MARAAAAKVSPYTVQTSWRREGDVKMAESQHRRRKKVKSVIGEEYEQPWKSSRATEFCAEKRTLWVCMSQWVIVPAREPRGKESSSRRWISVKEERSEMSWGGMDFEGGREVRNWVVESIPERR